MPCIASDSSAAVTQQVLRPSITHAFITDFAQHACIQALLCEQPSGVNTLACMHAPEPIATEGSAGHDAEHNGRVCC